MKAVPLFAVNMPESVDAPLLETLHSGYITQGEKVEQFEELLTGYFNAPAVTVNSGTSALTLALRLAGIHPGQEVITTAMTCSATNLPILSLGAVPVFADVDAETGLMNPNAIEGRITPLTRAIMVVDWGGAPVDYERIRAIANKHGLKLIADCAHAFGAPHTRRGRDRADFTCFSLQAIKHVTTVDGGVLLVRDPKEVARAKRLRWFGIERKVGSTDARIDEDIEEWGYKFHMNDVAATIGIEQMNNIESVLTHHRHIAGYYNVGLSKYFILPPAEGAHWLYTILLPNQYDRLEFQKYMATRNIQVSQVHRRNDDYTIFKKFKNYESPGLADFSERMVCIPIHTGIDSYLAKEIISVCNAFAGGRA